MIRTADSCVPIRWGATMAIAGGALSYATTAALEPWLSDRNAPDPIALLLAVAVASIVVLAAGVVTWAAPSFRLERSKGDGRTAMRLASHAGGAALFGAALAVFDGSLARLHPPGMAVALVGLDSLYCIAAAASIGGVVLFFRPLAAHGRRVGVIAFAAAVGSAWFAVTARLAHAAYAERSGLAWLGVANASLTAVAIGVICLAPAMLRTRFWRRLGWGGTLLCGAGVLAAAALVWPLIRATAEEVELLPPAAFLVSGVLAWSAGRALGRWKLSAAGLLLPLCLVWADRSLERRQDLPTILLRDPPVAREVLRAARVLGDFDRDGYAVWLGGGDCAPFDARRHPFAPERLDNGIDEDCSGTDLRASDLRDTDYRELGRAPVGPPPAQGTPDIVLVIVDALRARALGAHGATPSITPVMDALAKESVVFEQAYCLCPATHRALPSLITGMLPTELPESYADRRQAISDDRVTLFEALAERGYESNILFYETLLRNRNLAQGAEIHDDGAKGNAVDPRRTRIAQRLVRNWPERPQFLWLQLYAPHGPHRAPPGFRPRDNSELAAYEAEIRLSDHQLGLFLATLRSTPRGRDAVVILTADHGEEIYEHGRSRHAKTVYEEVMHVPLMISAPGVIPDRVATQVDHLDLATTIAAFAGRPGFGTGRDLRKSLAGGKLRARPVILELFPGRSNSLGSVAVIVDRKKLILNLQTRVYEYYDLRVDPLEQTNRFDAAPEEVAPLRQILLGHVERVRARSP